MTLRELITKIGFSVDLSGLARYDQAIGRAIEKTKSLHSNLSVVGEKMQSIGLKGALAIDLPMILLGKSSLQAASKVEQVGLKFEIMLNSATKSKALMADLFAYEAKTPFNLDQVLKFSDTLVMMKIPLEDITKTINMIGNATGGSATAMEGVLTQLFQVKNLGYAGLEDIKPMSSHGVPIIEALAKTMNLTTAGVMQAISTRQITYERLMDAMQSIATDRAGLLERQGKTLGGVWSSFESAIFRTKIALGEMIAEEYNIKEVLQKIIVVLGKIETYIKGMSPATRKWVAILGLVVLSIFPIIFALGTVLKTVGLITFGLRAMGAVGGLQALLKFATALSIRFAIVFAEVLFVLAGIAAIILIIQDLASEDSLMKEMWGQIWKDFLGALQPYANIIFKFWGDVWDSIANFFKNSFNAVTGAITGTIDYVKKEFNALNDWFNNLALIKWLMKADAKMSATLNKVTGTTFFSGMGQSSQPSAPAWQPPVSALTGLGGGGTSITLNTGDISIPVPYGTPESQKESLRKNAFDVFHSAIIDAVKKGIVSDVKAGTTR